MIHTTKNMCKESRVLQHGKERGLVNITMNLFTILQNPGLFTCFYRVFVELSDPPADFLEIVYLEKITKNMRKGSRVLQHGKRTGPVKGNWPTTRKLLPYYETQDSLHVFFCQVLIPVT